MIAPITNRTKDTGKTATELRAVDGTTLQSASTENLLITVENLPYINWGDLSRIEINCRYIAEQLNLYGYKVNITVKTDWDMAEFPYLIEINRIRDNINTLITAYHKMLGSPDIKYWNSLNWQDMNSLEQNLLNLNNLLELMKQSFRYSGTFYSGQEVVL
jgi:hypothetical protein